MNYAQSCAVSADANVCSILLLLLMFGLSISLILSCIYARRVVLPKFTKGGIIGPFGISCIIKNNMEFVQDVLVHKRYMWNTMFQHVCYNILSLTTDWWYYNFGSELFYPRFSLQRRSISHGEELIWMSWWNMWITTFLHVHCNIWHC